MAVWTSMTKGPAKKVINALFRDGLKESLLFQWYQSKCDRVEHTATSSSSAASAGGGGGGGGASCNGVFRDHVKPLFRKDLHKVWREYPAYNASNTVSTALRFSCCHRLSIPDYYYYYCYSYSYPVLHIFLCYYYCYCAIIRCIKTIFSFFWMIRSTK